METTTVQTVTVRYFRSTSGDVKVTIQSEDPRAIALNAQLARRFPKGLETWLKPYQGQPDDYWMSWLYSGVPLEECIQTAERAFQDEADREARYQAWRAEQPKKKCARCKREFLAEELMSGSLGSYCVDCYDIAESQA